MTRIGTFRPLPRRRAAASGFTLLEVLLSLAIIALLAAVLIGGSASLLSEQPTSVEEVFWKAVQEGRKEALKSGREVRLKFEAQKKNFILVDALAPAVVAADGITKDETPLKILPAPPAAAADLAVDFLSATKGGSSILVGGVLLESQPIPFVTFYPDGTCTPFRAQLARSTGARVLAIDPWTCAPVLGAKETP